MVNENIIIGNPIKPTDNIIGPGPNGLPKGPPIGYKPLKSTIPEVGKVAKSLLANNFGTMIPFSIDNVNYMARVEPHYHPPGFKNGPEGWHKGITVYQQSLGTSTSNKPKFNNQKVINEIDEFLKKFDNF